MHDVFNLLLLFFAMFDESCHVGIESLFAFVLSI